MASKAQNVRLPDEALQRLARISSASVRPTASLTVFAVSHALTLAHTDSDAFTALSIAELGPAPGDGRMNLSIIEPTLAHLLTSLMTTYAEDYKTPVRANQALRAAILAWLRSGDDEDLIEQVGAPPLPEKVAAMT